MSLNIYSNIFTFIFLLHNTVLVLPYINMNLPLVYISSHSWTPLLPLFMYFWLPASTDCLLISLFIYSLRSGTRYNFFCFLIAPRMLLDLDWWLMRRSVWQRYWSFWILRLPFALQSLRCLPPFIQSPFIKWSPHAKSSCVSLPSSKAQMTRRSLYQLNRRMKQVI